MKSIRRFDSGEFVPPGRACPDCNLRRTEAEYRIGNFEHLNCRNCWPKHGRKPIKKAARGAHG